MFRSFHNINHPIDRHLRKARPRVAPPPALPGMAALISLGALWLFFRIF